ncbi:Uncharacterized iron-regulated protein [Sulfitobacter marinus]|uniref:Uncharacterized iron-regulated protein n=1 Tax=Sulfitobacter marinus TaxID=394264 RepID=A0A1I6U3M9_9RHOB|nr:ChaN family lipoprotein [Sulfitobacter marinus]SFS95877.1 Uncharacterized iron-regulated protein [Sulfitobacter marinus]
MIRTICVFLALPVFASAQNLDDDLRARLAAAHIIVLGETHDNPAHHEIQADLVATIAPKAIVYEMITEAQASQVRGDIVQEERALEKVLGWDESGWPDFSMYYPIFVAGVGAKTYGAAVPRTEARKVMGDGLAAAFGADAEVFGLDAPLDPDQQRQREAMQMKAHCDALPVELLPAMVDVQRLRDARLAQVAIKALDDTGGPVVVITGNGHARADWGMPAAIALVRPDAVTVIVGQGEGGTVPEGRFDAVLQSPPAERDHPCLAFKKP